MECNYSAYPPGRRRNYRPLQKVATDVTLINIGGCKIYLSPVLDMFNGEIKEL